MPLSYAELEQFYEGLVRRARRRGIPCAAGDERLELALKGEVEFWHQFDRLRLRVHEQAITK